MGYQLNPADFDKYLTQLSETYRVYAPVRQKGKGAFSDTDLIGYGEIKAFSDMVLNEKSSFSPKEIFYPIRETLFYFKNNEMIEPEINEKPIILFLRPCDINGIKRLDEIFLNNGPEKDYYYLRRRQLLKFVMIECVEGFDSCFCVSMGANKTDQYEGAIRVNGSEITLDLQDDALYLKVLEEGNQVDFIPEFIQENKVKVTIPDVGLVTKETFNHELWKEYTSRCIGCGRCNTVCITCSCYTMQDVKTDDEENSGERRRVWASCHVDGFSDMAGGHSFRNKNGDRMRFKTMHKINDFYKRFGYHMCVGCGRCDDICPEYISFSKCINKLNQIVEEGQKHE
ncbi:MAG: anaerobic sulfite reductase subunit AsrA [Vallitaleaceae bacterium]|nr:anaerobic sulfite reductase subunit AsrA [Vallitaleaceae bacterium]